MLVLVGLLLDSRGKRRAAFWWPTFGLGGVAVGLVGFVGYQGDAGAYSPLVHYVAEGGGTWRIPLILLFVSLAIVSTGILVRLYGDTMAARLRPRFGL